MMVGRVMHETRRIWLIIISILLIMGIAGALWLMTSRSKTEIPHKGVFVLTGINHSAGGGV